MSFDNPAITPELKMRSSAVADWDIILREVSNTSRSISGFTTPLHWSDLANTRRWPSRTLTPWRLLQAPAASAAIPLAEEAAERRDERSRRGRAVEGSPPQPSPPVPSGVAGCAA